MKEFSNIYQTNPLIKRGLQVEMEVAKMNYYIKRDGWNFDVDSAIQTKAMFTERMFQIESILEPKLGVHTVYIDKEPKSPKFKKDGTYSATTCRMLSDYFGHEVNPEDTHLMPAGKTFRRFKEEQIDLGQIALVKDWLLENGWKPDEYTRKMINGKWVNQGPKLTEKSLKDFGSDGELISEYYTLRNRLSVIEGWLEKIKDRGRLHGNMWTIGTPSFRARHEVIVNLPSVSSTYGEPLRAVFRADEGEVVVGCDSAGNQLRGLCHFVGNPEFTQEVIYGDQHQRNADALGCSRSVAKTYLYAYLFGAGDAKLGQTLGATGPKAKKVGAKSRSDFAKNIKGLQELNDSIKNEWNTNVMRQGVGWFKGLDGRPVFCESDHQCLNYLLQSTEAITCKAACVYAMDKIREEGLRAKPRIWYHDEMAFTSHPDDAQRVGEILKEAYTEAPKWFGVECMDGGDPQFGDTYAAVH
jgi:DNA polymerase-1